MKKKSLDSLPDVLTARDIAGALGIGYSKSLKVIKYGGLNYLKIGNVYRVSKKNFITWFDGESKIINLS
jgi:excisionase family DNA binding protein